MSQMFEETPRSEVPTKRQQQVLELIADDFPTQAIAENLDISYETAKTHVQTILWRLKVHSRAAAVAVAFRRGWLT